MSVAEGITTCTVNGGDGVYSYSKNSNFQRNAIDAVKELINKAITEKLDINIFSSSNTFQVADLGCAAGPNTFLAVQNIIDAVETKYQSQGNTSQVPEFQVFFNDHASNDFNQLFTSLPPKRRYFATGVPGSFHDRLFPRASLHFVHSSYSVQILSRVPKEVEDKRSPAWNKGRIHYSNSTDEVIKAYQAQYAKDMERFLKARGEEIVRDGLLAFVVPGRPDGSSHSDAFVNKASELLGSCLMDMAKKGKISSEKVDSLNFPMYYASPQEVEAAVKQNRYFSIEMMEIVPQEKPQPKAFSSTMRAGSGKTLKQHFGEEINLDELFDLLHKKFEENSFSVFESGNIVGLFVLLKRTGTE